MHQEEVQPTLTRCSFCSKPDLLANLEPLEVEGHKGTSTLRVCKNCVKKKAEFAQYESALDQIQAEHTARVPPLKDRVSAQVYESWERLRAHSCDVLSLSLLFLEAFPLIGNDPKTAGTLTGKWVRSIPRQASSWLIAMNQAVSLCAMLEGFLDEIGEIFVSSVVVERMRNKRTLPLADHEAQKSIRQWLRPTAKDGGSQWLGRLSDTFNIVVPPTVKACLLSMMEVRHKFTHERRPKNREDYPPFPGETLKCWMAAVWLLAFEVAAATNAMPARPLAEP